MDYYATDIKIRWFLLGGVALMCVSEFVALKAILHPEIGYTLIIHGTYPLCSAIPSNQPGY